MLLHQYSLKLLHLPGRHGNPAALEDTAAVFPLDEILIKLWRYIIGSKGLCGFADLLAVVRRRVLLLVLPLAG